MIFSLLRKSIDQEHVKQKVKSLLLKLKKNM